MIADGEQKTKDVLSFLMIGQSNMAGRGEFGQVAPIVNDKCFMLRNGRWQRMAEPINPDRPIFEGVYHSGTCLGASFADCFAKAYDRKVGLIPCADGGTKIAQWQKGEVLYDHAVFCASLASRSSALLGILCHHGESDCNSEDITQYKSRFLRMIADLRADLGAMLPVVIGEVSERIAPIWGMGEIPKQINGILREIERELPLCKLVPTQDLALKEDGIHFDSPSLRKLGRRYFAAYQKLTEE